VPEEREILDKAVFSNILRLKYRTIEKLLAKNTEVLTKATSLEEQDNALTYHQHLKKAHMELAAHLGIVISGR
jgi:DNA primase